MKTTLQTGLKSRRFFYSSVIMIFFIPTHSHAEIYKCEDAQSGVIEYKQAPCDDTQSTHEIEGNPRQSSNSRRNGELIYKNKLVKDLGDEVVEECMSKLVRRGFSKEKSERQCNDAIDKFAFCVVDAQKSALPSKASDGFFTALEAGKSEEEAWQEAKKREHWGNITQDQRIRKMFLLQGMMEMCKDEFKKIYFK